MSFFSLLHYLRLYAQIHRETRLLHSHFVFLWDYCKLAHGFWYLIYLDVFAFENCKPTRVNSYLNRVYHPAWVMKVNLCICSCVLWQWREHGAMLKEDETFVSIELSPLQEKWQESSSFWGKAVMIKGWFLEFGDGERTRMSMSLDICVM